MKKILFLFLAFAYGANAQTEIATVFRNDMNYLFQHVNRTPVTTGLLKDYGLMLTNVNKFNGTLMGDNHAGRSAWTTLYTSIYSMRFNSNATLATPEAVNTAINSHALSNPGVNHLMALHYQYEQFKPTAATGNLVYLFNNQIYDTPNRPTTPYEVKDAVAFAATGRVLSGATQVFLLRPELFYSNVTKGIMTLQVDFGDGLGLKPVMPGTNTIVTYPGDGEKILILRVAYTDGQVVQAQTKVFVTDVVRTCANCRYSSPRLETFPKGNFPVPVAQMGTGVVSVATAGTDGILDKPLILVEGFDPENAFNLDTYLSSNSLGVRVNIDFNGQRLSELLEARDYDLVFLNYGWGGDDIKRNAYLLENVIQWVNQQTAAAGSTQKNVVIGVSMGGLVARYALRDMELRNANHNTRLYGSVDSPHQGANVPLGFQAAIRYLAGLNILGVNLAGGNPELNRGVAALNSPAASQMLTYQLTGTGPAILLNNNTHVSFMNEYRTMGLPRLWGIRTISLASGSECGTSQGFSPYSVMLEGSGNQDINYFLGLLASFFLPIDSFPFESLLATDSDIRINTSIRSLPDRQTAPVFTIRISYRKEILWGLGTNTRDLVNFSFNSNSTMFPLDSNPGGRFDVNSFARIPSTISIINLNLRQPRFNFIPTTSSLDIGSGTQVLTMSDYTRIYSPFTPPAAPKNVPFNNFYTNPRANETHVQLTTQNGNWLFQEINQSPVVNNCLYVCTNSFGTISGSSSLCTTGSYSLSGFPVGANVSWSVSPSFAVTSSTGSGPTANIQLSTTPSSQITLTFSLTTSCGTDRVSRTISTGRPQFTNNKVRGVQYSGSPVYLCPGNHWLETTPVGATSSTAWQVPVPYIVTNGNYVDFTLPANFSSVVITATASNSCGSTNQMFILLKQSYGCGSGYFLSAFPNPTDEKLTISFEDENQHRLDSNQGQAVATIDEIVLYNENQQKVFQSFQVNHGFELETAKLPPGKYVLHVRVGDELMRQQIYIKH
jgi:pimeloyl-ACP methyl ester carboxylesterase